MRKGSGGRLQEVRPVPTTGDRPPRPKPVKGSRRREPTRRRRALRTVATITLFLLPGLALFLLLVLLPIVIAAYTSLFRWNGLGGWPRAQNFLGLGNFTRLFEDPIFWGDLRHMAVLIILSLVIQLPMALGLALLLNQRMRGRAIYRAIFFAPYVLSEVITGVLFTMVFSPETGLANHVLGLFGITEGATEWLADPDIVLYSVFLVITWKYFGFHMILYLAGRQGIPNELLEAAALDGAGPWKQFRHVTLPLLGPTIRMSVFLSIIGSIQLFDLVWVLTQGGPVHASETMAVTMYHFGFNRNQFGYASAISVAMFIISLIFALSYQRFVLRRDTQGAITSMGGLR
ncbi:sugar ABC transporter permease [Thermopolyspora sp. NPDC052614]|uniref:carbohydrate ABC transporter permease n=1 Tax=Thermopolyspora sp. NPDC052614 TaxID=3155682 RepID=UPI00342C795C